MRIEVNTSFLTSVIILVGIGFLGTFGLASPVLEVNDLRCEYAVDPLGLDILHPRLSWKLAVIDSDTRQQYQTAYQILVSSGVTVLEANNGDIWDLGKVVSDQSTQIAYEGTALTSNIVYYLC